MKSLFIGMEKKYRYRLNSVNVMIISSQDYPCQIYAIENNIPKLNIGDFYGLDKIIRVMYSTRDLCFIYLTDKVIKIDENLREKAEIQQQQREREEKEFNKKVLENMKKSTGTFFNKWRW